MEIYRIEHAVTGLGPYQQPWDGEDWDPEGPEGPEPRRYEMSAEHCSYYARRYHPVVTDDIPELSWADDYRCCFIYLSDLHAWFDGWIPELLSQGFQIVTREVPDDKIYLGSYQAAYLVR